MRFLRPLGQARRSGAAVGLLLLSLLAGVMTLAAPQSHAQASPGATVTADLVLDRAGVLQVNQQVSVPEGHRFQMAVPLRIAVDGGDRQFAVTDIHHTGPGNAQVAEDVFTLSADPGQSTFHYAVHGTVGDARGSQVFRWFGMIDADIAALHATLLSPSYEMGIVSCTLGTPPQSRPCHKVQVEPDGTLYLDQNDLHQGEPLDLTVQIPPGTVPANANIEQSGTAALRVNATVLTAWGVLLAAIAALAGYILWARHQETRAEQETPPPLLHTDKQVQLTSPAGFGPAAVSILLTTTASGTDIAATVLDLAVRGYLRIEPAGDTDWCLTSVHGPDETLLPSEKMVYQSLFPADTTSVRLSELKTPGRLPAETLKKALRRDVIAQGALHGRFATALPLSSGIALLVIGVIATVWLLLRPGHALVGATSVLAGAAALVARPFLPRRTAHGRRLAGQLRSWQRHFDTLDVHRIPAADRAVVFARGLPYTLATGRADHWIRTFRDLNPSAPNQAGLWWFAGFDNDRELHRFAARFPYFNTALVNSCQ